MPQALPPLELLDRSYADLAAELTTRDPDSAAPTWYQPGAGRHRRRRRGRGADPVPLPCWLWGRGGEETVSVSGDPGWAAYLRRLLVATTQ